VLDVILGDPANDDVRAVYADQLLDRGDPRGEYIAVELRLAAAARGSKERAALARRRSELRRAHANEWWPELPESRIRTRRGFVETALVTSTELDILGKLAEREPLATVEILGTCTKPPAHAKWQDRIRRLIVHCAGEQLLPLLDSPLGCAIDELVLATSSEELPVLNDRLPRCRRLCLAGMGLRAYGGPKAWLEPLAQWSYLDRLEFLDLSYSGMVDEFAELDLPALRILRLSGNRLVPRSAAPKIAKRLGLLPALARLEFIGTEVHPDDVALLRTQTRAELILDVPPLPDRITIDIGSELELVRLNGSDWAIWLDGVRVPIRIPKPAPPGPTVDALVDCTDLGRLARALSKGVPPHCTDEALTIAYDRSVRYSNYWSEPSWDPPDIDQEP